MSDMYLYYTQHIPKYFFEKEKKTSNHKNIEFKKIVKFDLEMRGTGEFGQLVTNAKR